MTQPACPQTWYTTRSCRWTRTLGRITRPKRCSTSCSFFQPCCADVRSCVWPFAPGAPVICPFACACTDPHSCNYISSTIISQAWLTAGPSHGRPSMSPLDCSMPQDVSLTSYLLNTSVGGMVGGDDHNSSFSVRTPPTTTTSNVHLQTNNELLLKASLYI